MRGFALYHRPDSRHCEEDSFESDGLRKGESLQEYMLKIVWDESFGVDSNGEGDVCEH